MPYRVFGQDNERNRVDPALPLSLNHKPIYAMPYQQYDGKYKNGSDARYISVGFAQWDNDDDLSLKIMRFVVQKWSRQSEELPLHRVFDSALFLAKCLFDNAKGTVIIEKNCFENQDNEIEVTRENLSEEDIEHYDALIAENIDSLRQRLNSLYAILKSMKQRNKF